MNTGVSGRVRDSRKPLCVLLAYREFESLPLRCSAGCDWFAGLFLRFRVRSVRRAHRWWGLVSALGGCWLTHSYPTGGLARRVERRASRHGRGLVVLAPTECCDCPDSGRSGGVIGHVVETRKRGAYASARRCTLKPTSTRLVLPPNASPRNGGRRFPRTCTRANGVTPRLRCGRLASVSLRQYARSGAESSSLTRCGH